jgi:hypothetical protein
MQYQKELDIEVLNIGSSNAADVFSSPETYPLYVRVIMTITYSTKVAAQFVSRLGWK